MQVDPKQVRVGSVINIVDPITRTDNISQGTVRLVEEDKDIPELLWFYVRANNEAMNVQHDPRIGSFWRVIASTETEDYEIIMI